MHARQTQTLKRTVMRERYDLNTSHGLNSQTTGVFVVGGGRGANCVNELRLDRGGGGGGELVRTLTRRL